VQRRTPNAERRSNQRLPVLSRTTNADGRTPTAERRTLNAERRSNQRLSVLSRTLNTQPATGFCMAERSTPNNHWAPRRLAAHPKRRTKHSMLEGQRRNVSCTISGPCAWQCVHGTDDRLLAVSEIGFAQRLHLLLMAGGISRARTAAMAEPRDIEPRVFALAVDVCRWARARPAGGIDRDLVRQLVRATTSIGANLEEARAAETKPDFVHKVSVARKESLEAEYWARLMLADSTDETLTVLTGELHEVSAVLTSIARNSRASLRRG
jgi:four helix bundle protein